MTDVILRVGFSFSKPPFVLADPPFTDGDYDVEGGGLGLEIDFFRLGESFAAAVELAASYRELGNQHGQVQDFLDESSDALVIDGLVFRHWARASDFDPDAFEFHDIFEPVTTFHAGFRSETLRDGFEAGLKELRTSGEYERVVGSYVG